MRAEPELILLLPGRIRPEDSRLDRGRRRRLCIGSLCVGLGVGSGLFSGVRGKLKELAEETGGRVFFIGRAEELDTVYDEIEEELRSRYLIAYQSDRAGGGDEYRAVEVKIGQRGLTARTIRGYYP